MRACNITNFAVLDIRAPRKYKKREKNIFQIYKYN